jgi:Putative zinc-finger
MNCETCQELISDLVDGALSRQDEATLNLHLQECLDCADVRNDLEAVVGYCRSHRDEYEAPPNERALWLRIANTLEADNGTVRVAHLAPETQGGFFGRWLNRSWQLSLPQLAASVSAIAIIVALVTVVGLKRIENGAAPAPEDTARNPVVEGTRTVGFDLNSRMWQQQQTISYWNTRIATNRARWSPEMRDTFDRNLSVIDQALNDSLKELNKNPHDEVSEEMLNAALNEKIALLKEFSEL